MGWNHPNSKTAFLLLNPQITNIKQTSIKVHASTTKTTIIEPKTKNENEPKN